jgi:hypothetical protein
MSQLTLTVAPAQHGRLHDIDDIQPINDSDSECLTEISHVLKKYGKRERFGVALLHKHFDLAEGEILLETTDKQARVLTIKPVQKAEAGPMIETVWELGEGKDGTAILGCKLYCGYNIHGGHSTYHQMT